jgi:hypothetical protein
LQGGAKHYPLTIRRVKEIKQLNAKGVKPDDLQPVELTTAKEAEHNFVDVVGHLTIGNLEKTTQRNKEKQKQQQQQKKPQQQAVNLKNQQLKPQQSQQQRPNNPQQNQMTTNRNKPPQKGK